VLAVEFLISGRAHEFVAQLQFRRRPTAALRAMFYSSRGDPRRRSCWVAQRWENRRQLDRIRQRWSVPTE